MSKATPYKLALLIDLLILSYKYTLLYSTPFNSPLSLLTASLSLLLTS
jgi:hypothetical protein